MISSAPPTATPEISVVVPTYQRAGSVLRLLRALDRQTLPADAFEVVVVIDGSTDGSLERIREHPASYRLRAIWKENGGRASSCNLGIREASGRLLVLLDDDMEPTPSFLASHLAAHRETDRLGGVGAAPIQEHPSLTGAALFAARKFNDHMVHLAQKREITGLREFYSGNFSIPRETILSVGGFDEAFRIYGNEDVELGIRLRAAGVRLVFLPDAVAYQAWDKTSAQLARDSLAKGRTAMVLLAKHPELAGHLRVGRLAELPPATRLLASVASRPWINRPAAAAMTRAMPVLEALGLRRSMRFYSLWSSGLFWLGALGSSDRQGDA